MYTYISWIFAYRFRNKIDLHIFLVHTLIQSRCVQAIDIYKKLEARLRPF